MESYQDELDRKWQTLKPRIEARLNRKVRQKRMLRGALAGIPLLFFCMYLGYLWNEQTITITTGSIAKELQMPDGTKVKLNRNSAITYYRNTYFHSARHVTLEGEAFFDVVHNPDKPFIIESSSWRTTVLGTSFNLCTNKGDAKPALFVATGKVRLEHKPTGTLFTVPAGQEVYWKQQHLVQAAIVDENALAWFTHKLSFNQVPLHRVAATLKDYFLVSVEVRDEKLANTLFTGSFQNPSLKEMMDAIQYAAKARLQRDENTYYLISAPRYAD